MSDTLKSSWGSFSKDIAGKYLKSFGHPSQASKKLLSDILKTQFDDGLKIVDLGCGNANLAEFLHGQGLQFAYHGVDFSEILLDAARTAYPNGTYICDDVNKLTKVPTGFDVACYSHVIEMLPSPESSLMAASKIADKIVIRFFDPPEEREDWVELLEMDIGNDKKVPYLRRKMSLAYYQLILHRIGCKSVDIYHTDSDRDQIHILHF
jgi:ubiquinone/menaquinone biosynthesis C-methylase UbiE